MAAGCVPQDGRVEGPEPPAGVGRSSCRTGRASCAWLEDALAVGSSPREGMTRLPPPCSATWLLLHNLDPAQLIS